MTRWERLKYTIVRPDDDADDKKHAPTIARSKRSRTTIRRSDDKERAIGLVAAPLAAIIGIVISSASINYAKSHHQSVTVYDELTYVILGHGRAHPRDVAAAQAALPGHHHWRSSAWRVFNLHYWGFGVPFLLAGAWYLVRAYRLQQALKRAGGRRTPARHGATAAGPPTGRGRAPNKRYTPPDLSGLPGAAPLGRRPRRTQRATPRAATQDDEQDRREDEDARRRVLGVDDRDR